MKNWLIAILLGTLALFVWSAFSWMVLQLHDNSFKNIPESVVLAADFKSTMPAAGVYHYPGLPTDGNWEAAMKKAEEGPAISLMVFLPDGITPFSPISFLLSLCLNLLAVAMACYFLMQTNLATYGSKVLFVAMLGLFAGVVVEIPKGMWFNFPASHVIPYMVDYIVGWTLVGAILARFIK